MKNELRLRAINPLVDVRPLTAPTRRERELDLYSLSGYRRQSPIRALSTLWQRAKERSKLIDALDRARANTDEPRF